MMNDIKFAIYAIKKNIANSAELRTSFLMNILGMVLNNCSFLIIWICFIRAVGGIGGWRQIDVVGLQGFSALAFGVAVSLFNGIARISQTVMSGGFDRYLLSPKNLLLRVATSYFGVSAVGDIVFGLLCLIVYGFLIHANALVVLMMFVGVVVASVTCVAALLISQVVSFWVMDGTSVSRSIFELFLTPSLFVGGAFQGWMRFAFTFIIPALVIGSLPVEVVKEASWVQMGGLALLAAVFMSVAIALFYKGVRSYESASLGGFGS